MMKRRGRIKARFPDSRAWRRLLRRVDLGTCLIAGLWGFILATGGAQEMKWTKLPPLPDKEGFAGMFAGASHGALVIAGGANFPGRRPWEGGTKVWYDNVWALDRPDGEWRIAGKLPRALGYGGAVTFENKVICLGGSGAKEHHAECFSLEWREGKITPGDLPALPRPCANFCAARVGSTIYVAGGIERPDATIALHTFWSLDLKTRGAKWLTLDPWPGRERMLAVAAAADGSFFMFSGAALKPGAGGQAVREWLRDAYRFTPGKGWSRLPDLPRVAVAAPTPAPVAGGRVFIISGDDGTKSGFKPETEHPGFPRDGLRFDVRAGQWGIAGEGPLSRATMPVTLWRGSFIFPNGEVRPGFRTNEVWSLELKP